MNQDESTPTRKLCTSKHHQGPRWLLLYNFYPKTYYKHQFTPDGDLIPKSFQSWCMACQRIYQRHYRGLSPNPRPPGLNKDQRNARRRARYQALTPEQKKQKAESRREYERERQAAARRQRGIPPAPTPKSNRRKPLRDKKGRKITNPYTYLPAQPLLNYLTHEAPTAYTQLLSHTSQRRVREARTTGRIELRALDHIILDLDAPHLLPQLYPEE